MRKSQRWYLDSQHAKEKIYPVFGDLNCSMWTISNMSRCDCDFIYNANKSWSLVTSWQGNVTVVRREFCSKSVFKYHLLNWKCHYFYYECMGLKKTNLSLLKCVTFSLVCVWVKSNWLNVTKYEVFIFWRRP